MEINGIFGRAQQWIPSAEGVANRFSTSLPRIAANVNQWAIPIVALCAFVYAQGVEAGPLMYASCIAGCIAMGPFAPACWAACLPVLAIPGP